MNIHTIPINARQSAAPIVVLILYSLLYETSIFFSYHPSNGTKVNIIPPATTDPIWPPTLALIAGISK